MSRVIDLAGRRPLVSALSTLSHPAGVTLPLDDPGDAALLVPAVRRAISAGSYSADLIRLLPDAVHEGDRVLVIGAGLGVVSTLIAKFSGVESVLALEANTALIPYLQRVHASNDVPWIDTLNAVPALEGCGRVPFFARRDVRLSSLLPERDDWLQAMLVPVVDLNLIVADEKINVIVSEVPTASAAVLGALEPGRVERIAIGDESHTARPSDETDLVGLLARRGFALEKAETALLFGRRASTARGRTSGANSSLGTGT